MSRPRDAGSILNILDKLDITEKDKKDIKNINNENTIKNFIITLSETEQLYLIENLYIFKNLGIKPKELKSILQHPLKDSFLHSLVTLLPQLEAKAKHIFNFIRAYKKIEHTQLVGLSLHEFRFKDFFAKNDLTTFNNFILINQIEDLDHLEDPKSKSDIAYKYYLIGEIEIADKIINYILDKHSNFGFATYVKVLILYAKEHSRYSSASNLRLLAGDENSYVNQSIMEDRADDIALEGYQYSKLSFDYISSALRNWEIRECSYKKLAYTDEETRNKIIFWFIGLAYFFHLNHENSLIYKHTETLKLIIDEIIEDEFYKLKYKPNTVLLSLKFVNILMILDKDNASDIFKNLLNHLCDQHFLELSDKLSNIGILVPTMTKLLTHCEQDQYIQLITQNCINHHKYNRLKSSSNMTRNRVYKLVGSKNYCKAFNVSLEIVEELVKHQHNLKEELYSHIYTCCEIISVETDFNSIPYAINQLDRLLQIIPDLYYMFKSEQLWDFVDHYTDTDGVTEVNSYTPINDPYLMENDIEHGSDFSRFIEITKTIVTRAESSKITIPDRLSNLSFIQHS